MVSHLIAMQIIFHPFIYKTAYMLFPYIIILLTNDKYEWTKNEKATSISVFDLINMACRLQISTENPETLSRMATSQNIFDDSAWSVLLLAIPQKVDTKQKCLIGGWATCSFAFLTFRMSCIDIIRFTTDFDSFVQINACFQDFAKSGRTVLGNLLKTDINGGPRVWLDSRTKGMKRQFFVIAV